jgi:osmotically-inducible protein OsmY
VTLSGEVPHEEARLDLGRVAGAVAGVGAVDNQVTVTDP